MSLLLNGAKTLTIAGTEMSCIEIYTGESYTLPIQFIDGVGDPIDCTGWILDIGAKFYVADTITYDASGTDINIGNLTLNVPQPSTGVGTYSANLTASFTTANIGAGYIYIPANLTGGTGTTNLTPVISLANSSANSTMVVLSLGVSRVDDTSGLTDYNKEPIGVIVRYQ
jgi:hypothetical protein